MLLEILVLLFTLSVLLTIYFKQKSVRKLPPGPWKLPIVGSLFSMAAAHPTFAHLGMHKLSKKYGPIMSLKLGVHEAVVLASFDSMKSMLTHNAFSGRYDGFPFVRDRSFHQILGLVFTNGRMWSDVRRFTMRNLREVGFGKRNSMEATVEADLAELISQFKSEGTHRIEPDLFTPCIANILWSYLAGFKFKLNDARLKALIKHNVAVVKAFNFNNISIPFPYLRHWFPRLTKYYESMKAHTQLQEFVQDLINEIRAEMKKGNEKQSFMEAFIREIDRNPGKSNEETIFTDQQLIMLVKDMFVAGSETTSYTLSWSILYMVLYPEVQSKVQLEIDSVIAPGATISMDDLKKMPYTEAVMLEVFRIALATPLLLPRKAMTDGELHGYFIPKGTAIFPNMYSNMMDEEYWGDPTAFRPERFLNKSQTQVINKERMIMFGMGKRVCVGDNMARLAIFLYFANMLQTFTFRLPPGARIPSTEPQANFLTMKPHPYDAIVTQRNKPTP